MPGGIEIKPGVPLGQYFQQYSWVEVDDALRRMDTSLDRVQAHARGQFPDDMSPPGTAHRFVQSLTIEDIIGFPPPGKFAFTPANVAAIKKVNAKVEAFFDELVKNGDVVLDSSGGFTPRPVAKP